VPALSKGMSPHFLFTQTEQNPLAMLQKQTRCKKRVTDVVRTVSNNSKHSRCNHDGSMHQCNILTVVFNPCQAAGVKVSPTKIRGVSRERKLR